MDGGRKHGVEICGVKSSRRPRHTRGCSVKEEVEQEQAKLQVHGDINVNYLSTLSLTQTV
jgi:hypothetical protein